MNTRNLAEIDQDITDPSYGTPPEKRSIEQLLDYGLILLDKPPGPTSHETVAWTKRLLGIEKAGHSGTLDPQVSGVLPLGLGEATKALGVLLLGPKEYHALGRVHTLASKERLAEVVSMFSGPIYQRPPQRSAVSRQTRIRTIHELEVLERKERLLLMRIVCESGTYIRKLYYDMGEILGPGATMIELRRTRVNQFYESDGLVTLHELANAFALWKDGDGSRLSAMIRPVEDAFSELKTVVIRDSAVDALCHGAQLAVPGVLQVTAGLKKGDLVAVYTQKGEAVALAEASMPEDEIRDATRGYAFETRRIIMAPGTYPKKWRTRQSSREK
ncbi:MAG: RNA-guided pseudouridylation complex pseudouridine synthase subunit Cbf5 [Nitrosopumilus sp. H8]|nr:MAG: RNA-guided pseudouridylation complex pseudouridine synthase subunit Cbf5 [Nitrosopumilus sp. H8]